MPDITSDAVNSTTAAKAEGDSSSKITIEQMKKELERAEARERDYRKETVGVIKLYEGVEHETAQYNILYSNTDTMQPALYNSTPRPVVQRRFKVGEDTMAKAGSTVMQRLLTFLVGDEIPDKPSFDNLMSEAVLSGLLASRGATRFRYEAELQKSSPGEEAAESPTEQAAEPNPEPAEEISYECVFGEAVPWNSILFGYAKRWSALPWLAFCHLMTPEEFKENFPDAKVDEDALKKAYGDAADTSDKATGDAGKSDGTGAVSKIEVGGVVLIPVYEIWYKETKQVLFCSMFSDDWLKTMDDPLGLRGFFPMPEPLNFMQRLSSMVPVPLYRMYQEQAEELNTITLRIQKIVRALKVRGLYDGSHAELKALLTAGDNDMIPVENAEVLYSLQGSIEKSVWLFPVQDLVGVLQQLYTQRQQIKNIIFEITGLADIMRGASQASETLGAQEIKNQWGTLRLKRLQKAVMKYARDSLRIMGEIAVTKMQPERIKAITNSDLPSAQDKQIAQMQMQQGIASGQQPPPELVAQLQMPSFEEVIAMLKDDLTRSYKIDIETNSTIEAEATEDKEDVIEVLNALGQFLVGVGPLIQEGVLPFDAAKAMMLTIIRKFKFGTDIEDQINQMKPPVPQPPQGADAKPAAPAEDPRVAQAQAQLDLLKAQRESENLQQEMEANRQQHTFNMAELARKEQVAAAKFQQDMTKAALPPPMPAAARPGAPKPAARKP